MGDRVNDSSQRKSLEKTTDPATIQHSLGSYVLVFALSAAFSLTGVLVISTLDSTSQVLIPDWEESLPPEARNDYVPGSVAADD